MAPESVTKAVEHTGASDTGSATSNIGENDGILSVSALSDSFSESAQVVHLESSSFQMKRAGIIDRVTMAAAFWVVFTVLNILVKLLLLKFSPDKPVVMDLVAQLGAFALWCFAVLRYSGNKGSLATPVMKLLNVSLLDLSSVNREVAGPASSLYDAGPQLFILYYGLTSIALPNIAGHFNCQALYFIDISLLLLQHSSICEMILGVQYVKTTSIERISEDGRIAYRSFIVDGEHHYMASGEGAAIELSRPGVIRRGLAFLCDFFIGVFIYNTVALLLSQNFVTITELCSLKGLETLLSSADGLISSLSSTLQSKLPLNSPPFSWIKLNITNVSVPNLWSSLVITPFKNIDINPGIVLYSSIVVVAMNFVVFAATGSGSIGDMVCGLGLMDSTKFERLAQSRSQWKYPALILFNNLYFVMLYNTVQLQQLESHLCLVYFILNTALLIGLNISLPELILDLRIIFESNSRFVAKSADTTEPSVGYSRPIVVISGFVTVLWPFFTKMWPTSHNSIIFLSAALAGFIYYGTINGFFAEKSEVSHEVPPLPLEPLVFSASEQAAVHDKSVSSPASLQKSPKASPTKKSSSAAKLTPVKDTPINETPAKATSVKTTPIKDTPKKVTPARTSSVKRTPASK